VNTPADEKVTAMAQETIRRLNDSTTNLTVEDLNGVRQVVAKLDALIDIEKHLNELDKVREEHHGGKASMTPVPASELAPPLPVTVPVAAPPPPLPLPNAMQQNTGPGAQLLRISGYDGHYAATFRIAGVETATLRVGDHDPDIGTVKMITASSVQVERNGDMRTMHVRNVDTIFNSSNY
jgi:type IV pilus biogenesis protein PilP